MADRKVLICAAHPDDEALGCGATMARHAADGDAVSVLFVSDGVASRQSDGRDVAAETAERRICAREAARLLGAAEPVYLGLPDQRLDTLPLLEITQAIEGVLADLRPDIVYTHHGGDLNADHRITAQALLTAARPVPGQSIAAIYGFEILSSTEWAFATPDPFRPQRFVGVETTLESKMAALEAYRFEMRDFPHARSLEAVTALARHRGATVGLTAAEAFTVYRECVA